MIKKLSKRLLPFLISPLLLFLYSDSEGCGPYIEKDDYYSVFEPEIINEPLLKPFFLSEYHFHPYNDSTALNSKLANLREWQCYFNSKPSLKDIEAVIYTSTADEIKELRMQVEKKALPDEFKANSLVQYLIEESHADFLRYLHFAKLCEPHVAVYDVWDEPDRDTLQMSLLANEGLKFYEQTNDEMLKLRYVYQIVRLLHYTGKYQKALDVYDALVDNNVNSIIKYWVLSHKAGILKRQGKSAESLYLFSRIFAQSPSRRLIASDNISARSKEIFSRALSFCEDENENAVLWFLRGYHVPGAETEAMENIHSLNPKSKYLEVLLVREVERIERSAFPSAHYYYEFGRNNDLPENDFAFEYNTIKQIAEEQNTANPYLWSFATGYIASLIGDHVEGDYYYQKADEQLTEDKKDFRNELRVFSIINEVNKQQEITKVFEDEILNDLKWVREKSKDALIYIFYQLAKKYEKAGDELKLKLALGNFPSNYDLKKDPHSEPVDDIYELMTSENKPGFEKFLLKNYKYSLDDIIEIQGTVLLSNYQFNEAVEKFKEMKRELDPLPADPFLIHINDCHDCDFKLPKGTTYTKLTFAERMIELHNLVREDSENRAHCHHLLGNGYYNISYFGNSWMVIDFYRNHSGFGWNGTWRDEWNYSGVEYFDQSKALHHYKKAAELTDDEEFAAFNIFLAAKCEQNQYYLSESAGNLDKKLNYRTNCIKLHKDYYDTDFYEEVLKECKYFNLFVKKYY